MADPVPVSERCALAVIEILKGISRGDTYRNTATVERAMPDGNPAGIEDASLFIVVDDDPPAPQIGTSLGLCAWDVFTMDMQILYTPVMVDGGEEGATQVAMASAHADVYAALNADPQLGGLAVNTTIGPPSYVYPFGTTPWATLTLGIQFWTAHNDPFTTTGD